MIEIIYIWMDKGVYNLFDKLDINLYRVIHIKTQVYYKTSKEKDRFEHTCIL